MMYPARGQSHLVKTRKQSTSTIIIMSFRMVKEYEFRKEAAALKCRGRLCGRFKPCPVFVVVVVVILLSLRAAFPIAIVYTRPPPLPIFSPSVGRGKLFCRILDCVHLESNSANISAASRHWPIIWCWARSPLGFQSTGIVLVFLFFHSFYDYDDGRMSSRYNEFVNAFDYDQVSPLANISLFRLWMIYETSYPVDCIRLNHRNGLFSDGDHCHIHLPYPGVRVRVSIWRAVARFITVMMDLTLFMANEFANRFSCLMDPSSKTVRTDTIFQFIRTDDRVTPMVLSIFPKSLSTQKVHLHAAMDAVMLFPRTSSYRFSRKKER